MHAVGIHSAMAIKRQRKRRDDQKKKLERERRYSLQSSESGDLTAHNSPRTSFRRKYHSSVGKSHDGMDTQVMTSIGMLHIGVVFLVFGLFLIGAGIFPDDPTSWSLIKSTSWWNELICTGLFAVGLGIFLIILNYFLSKREEEDLEKYVQRQLTRSRSGHRLERDIETGVLTTKHHRRALQHQRKLDSFDNLSGSNLSQETNEMTTPTTPGGIGASGEMLLEKIMEEDSSYVDERNNSLGGEGVISPIYNADTKQLLGNGHSYPVHVTKI